MWNVSVLMTSPLCVNHNPAFDPWWHIEARRLRWWTTVRQDPDRRYRVSQTGATGCPMVPFIAFIALTGTGFGDWELPSPSMLYSSCSCNKFLEHFFMRVYAWEGMVVLGGVHVWEMGRVLTFSCYSIKREPDILQWFPSDKNKRPHFLN